MKSLALAPLLCLSLVACAEGEPVGPTPTRDSGTTRMDASAMDSGITAPNDVAIPTDVVTSRGEICGNGLDDNFDGRVDEGCVCTTGMTQQCFAGDPARAGVGMCTYGTQRCEGNTEFGHWGACEGSVDDPACGPGSDASVPGDAAGGEDSGVPVDCPCIPGRARYCDTPVGCLWGIQYCRPDRTWGTCVETRDVPDACREVPFGDLFGHTYDTECCVRSGRCCQNYPADNSVGNCSNSLSCQ